MSPKTKMPQNVVVTRTRQGNVLNKINLYIVIISIFQHMCNPHLSFSFTIFFLHDYCIEKCDFFLFSVVFAYCEHCVIPV